MDFFNQFISLNILEKTGSLVFVFVSYKIFVFICNLVSFLFKAQPKKVIVSLTKEESDEKLSNYPKFDTAKLIGEQKKVYLWDPSTLDYFGETKAMTSEEVTY